MKQDLFTYLPWEIFADILLRLPLKNIAICKNVCKPWLDLIESDYFFKSHLSKSAPALVISMPSADSNWFNVFELEDKPNHKPERDPIIKFDFPEASTIQGSSNGLLLLKNPFMDKLYVCNPITSEGILLSGRLTCRQQDCYGIGVSRISGQHKVVHLNPYYGCHVYTLESGSSWRHVEAAATPLFDRCLRSVGALVSGNLHWLVSNKNEIPYICCFDLEAECFSTLSPSLECYYKGITSPKGTLYTLGDCLCFCNDEPNDSVIWLMKEYEQVEKYWSKVHVIPVEEPKLKFSRKLYFCQESYKATNVFSLSKFTKMVTC